MRAIPERLRYVSCIGTIQIDITTQTDTYIQTERQTDIRSAALYPRAAALSYVGGRWVRTKGRRQDRWSEHREGPKDKKSASRYELLQRGMSIDGGLLFRHRPADQVQRQERPPS